MAWAIHGVVIQNTVYGSNELTLLHESKRLYIALFFSSCMCMVATNGMKYNYHAVITLEQGLYGFIPHLHHHALIGQQL